MLKEVQACENTGVETMKYAVQTAIEGVKVPCSLKQTLIEKELTEFEAVQLINNPPRNVLDLYVFVEEMEERLLDSTVEQTLELFSPYVKKTFEEPS